MRRRGCDEQLDRGPAEEHRRPQVDGEREIDRLRRGVLDRSADRHAGVVDQHVQRAEALPVSVDRGLDRLLGPEIRHGGLHRPQVSQPVDRREQLRLPAGNDGDAIPLLEQRARDA